MSGAKTRHAARVVLATVVSTLLVLSVGIVPATDAGALSPVGDDWLARINGRRASNGLAPLALDGELTGLAQGWAEHMAAQGMISHAPSLSSGVSSDWRKLGENVGMGPDSESIWGGFMGSPPHRGNLMDPAFTHVGIGVAFVGGTQFVVHRFMAVGGAGGGGGGSAPAPPPPPRRPRVAPPPPPSPPPPPPVEEPAPPPPPPPSAEPARVAAVLDALHEADA